MDFTIYNANVNLFCVSKLVFEFPPTGGIIRLQRCVLLSIFELYNVFFSRLSFNTVKLLRYVNGSDHMVMGFEIVFFLFVVYYLVEEILEIKKVIVRAQERRTFHLSCQLAGINIDSVLRDCKIHFLFRQI